LLQLVKSCFHVGDIPALPFNELPWFGLPDLLGHLQLQELAIHALHVVAENGELPVPRTSGENEGD
jgi:hypothetical protein